jgi:hypothetical protein
LIEAWQTLERIEAMESQDQRRFLRRMLLNNRKEEIDRFLAQCRDARWEKSLEDAARGSSIRLGKWIEAEESPPIGKLIGIEQHLRVVDRQQTSGCLGWQRRDSHGLGHRHV